MRMRKPWITGLQENAIPTGLKDVDELLGGFKPGEVTLIGSRPAMGKTMFALNLAVRAAVEGYKKVCFFADDVGMTEKRILSMLSGIPMMKLAKWELKEKDWDKYINARISYDRRVAITTLLSLYLSEKSVRQYS